MRDFVLEKICDLENWQATSGRKIWNWPVTGLSYIFLIALLLISNLFAIFGLVITLFVASKQPSNVAIIEIDDGVELTSYIPPDGHQMRF